MVASGASRTGDASGGPSSPSCVRRHAERRRPRAQGAGRRALHGGILTRILVLHGPNLNLLGQREPEIYGRQSLADIDASIARRAGVLQLEVECRQTNHEGQLVDWIQAAPSVFQGLILNAAGLTHTSVVVRDAVASAALPTVEVHLSNIYAREDFRRESLVAGVAWGQISGLGSQGYLLALDALAERLRS